MPIQPWETLFPPVVPGGVVAQGGGISSLVNANAQGLVAQQAQSCRIIPRWTMRVVKIAFIVITASSVDDACDVGIYDKNFRRLTSSGSQSGLLNSLGTKVVSVPPALLPFGSAYFVSFSVGAIGGTAAVVRGAQFSLAAQAQGFLDATVPEAMVSAASFPLPDPITNGGVASAPVLLALREV